MKKYYLIQLQDSRLEKTSFYTNLCSDFEKLNMKIFFVAKSDKGFKKKPFGRVEFFELMKPIIIVFS